ncbi:exonuclease [Pseudanabaena phage Pam1]|nr:exonuclease [Pseudanabaena phage Pam1]
MIEQRSDAWFAQRCGHLTASRIADMMAKTKNGWGASRESYADQLIAERLTGIVQPGFSNAAMQWGTETEPQARNAYEFIQGETVVEAPFVLHPTIAWSGASPDGFVGDKGLIEIKCPNTTTHTATLEGKPIPDKYIKQMQWQMACTETEWCDFASFDPRLPVHLQLHVTRVERNDALIAEIEAAAVEFLDEIAARIEKIENTYRKAA